MKIVPIPKGWPIAAMTVCCIVASIFLLYRFMVGRSVNRNEIVLVDQPPVFQTWSVKPPNTFPAVVSMRTTVAPLLSHLEWKLLEEEPSFVASYKSPPNFFDTPLGSFIMKLNSDNDKSIPSSKGDHHKYSITPSGSLKYWASSSTCNR